MYDYDSVIHENIFLIHHFIYHYVIHFTQNISDTLKTLALTKISMKKDRDTHLLSCLHQYFCLFTESSTTTAH